MPTIKLHPLKSSQRFSKTDFKRTTRLHLREARVTRFEAARSNISPALREGLLVELPKQAPLCIYGSPEEITNFVGELTTKPARLLRNLKIEGASQEYSFRSPNEQPKNRFTGPVSSSEVRADRLYSNPTSAPPRPTTREEERK